MPEPMPEFYLNTPKNKIYFLRRRTRNSFTAGDIPALCGANFIDGAAELAIIKVADGRKVPYAARLTFKIRGKYLWKKRR